ncbi:hypothetical protein E4U52_003832 [Claviceps spartinae]|nr:hypothetical protein E4U52_003832 [Claviceps spartinae]
MGGRAVSPGAALLRTSRMFSIPKPLPEPSSPNQLHPQHDQRTTPTMTKAFPQHQSITSPIASRKTGDWGLKRPFPLKTTMATSTPLIRIKHLDSVESVTDFSSAADHTLSLQKFQELRVAISLPQGVRTPGRTFKSETATLKSAFEEDSDVTDPRDRRNSGSRWKFNGPWLAGMNQRQFTEYLKKTVYPRRAEFRELLKKKLAEDLTVRQNNASLETGTPPSKAIEISDITQEQLTEYMRRLRNDRTTLYDLIYEFLDLAPLGLPMGMTGVLELLDRNKLYGKQGPPASHPSAGISYLRTSAYIQNHPIYGPQQSRTPVLARVVSPMIHGRKAKLGVGGFIADVPSGPDFSPNLSRYNNTANSCINGILHLDLTTYGGAKAYVEPHTATVDRNGKVILRLHNANAEAQLIASESKGLSRIYLSDNAPSPSDKGPRRAPKW